MDVHDRFEGAANAADRETEKKFGVRGLRRWSDGRTGRTFFLIEAPNRDAAMRLHREVHHSDLDTLVEVREDAW